MKHAFSLLPLTATSPAFAAGPGMAGAAGMVLSLLLILGLFVLAAWLAKRYLPQVGKPGPVKVIGATAVGAREKVVVVEVENTWLVLGVGGGQVRALHALPKPQGERDENPK